MADDDFIMTIDSDTEESRPKKDVGEDAQLDPDFVFDLSGDPLADFLGEKSEVQDYVKKGSKPVRLLHGLLWDLTHDEFTPTGTSVCRRHY